MPLLDRDARTRELLRQLARFLAGHAIDFVGVAGPALHAAHDRADCHERRIGLGYDARFPFPTLGTFDRVTVARRVHCVSLALFIT